MSKKTEAKAYFSDYTKYYKDFLDSIYKPKMSLIRIICDFADNLSIQTEGKVKAYLVPTRYYSESPLINSYQFIICNKYRYETLFYVDQSEKSIRLAWSSSYLITDEEELVSRLQHMALDNKTFERILIMMLQAE